MIDNKVKKPYIFKDKIKTIRLRNNKYETKYLMPSY